MSHLEKMSIQGIRSFGPDDQDRQVLKFYSPLTLILGPNGTGKTTIIECLKYITTGTLPAGGKLQSTFIHDPKIAHESTVKAQVRLKFKNTTSKVCTITRSMQAMQQVKNVKMTTLDGTISMQRLDGENESVSSRCSDLDREMVSLLGVGKPVLENVIFCHQEDSTWPLSEGKALKAKFDDIFASTRYVKALESILKARKELGIKIKENQLEIKYLKQNKDKALQLKGDLSQAETKLEASSESTKEVEDKLAPIIDKLKKIEKSESGIHKLHTDIEKMKSERSEMEKGMKELRDNIVNELTDSTEGLEKNLSEFAGQVHKCEEKLKQYEGENCRLEAQLNEISEMKSRLLLEMGKLEQEAKGHEENVLWREKKISQVADSYGFSGFSGEMTDAHVDSFNEKLKEHRKQIEQEGKVQKVTFEEQESTLDAKILEINKEISSLNTQIRLKDDQMTENKNKVREIQKKLSQVEGSSGRLSEIKRELKNTKQEQADAEKNTNVDDLEKEIEKLNTLKSGLEPALKKLETELNKMHQESTVRTELAMLKKDKMNKEDKIKKLLSKNEDSLTELLGQVPDERVGRQLEDFMFTLDKSIEKETKSLEHLRMELAGKRQEHSSLTEQLSRKKAELIANKERLASEIDNQEYDEVRTELEEKLKIKNEDKGVLDGTSAMFTRYKSKLAKANAQCPLCHRDFDDEADITELIEELEKKLRTLPQKLETVEADIQELQERFNSVLTLEPVTRLIRMIEDKEIPELEARIKSVAERMEILTKKISETDKELKSKQSKSTTGNSMVPDLTVIDGYRRELRDLNKRIATQSAKVSGGESGRTLPQVQSEKDDVQDRLETARQSYDRKQKKLMNHQQVIARLNTNLNELGKEQLDLERNLQEQKENESKLEEFVMNNEILFAEIYECRENIHPLTDRMKKLKEEQREIVAKKEHQMGEVRDALSKLQEQSRDIRTIQENINRYLRAGRDTALDDCKEKQVGIETKADSLDTKRSAVVVKIKQRQEDLQTQKMQERNLQDNLALRRKKKAIKEKSEKIMIKENELGGLDVRHLVREKQQLNHEQEKLTKEKHHAEGRRQGILDEIKRHKQELGTDQFKDAEEKHRKKTVTLRTAEVASTDLEKYYRALDATIMNYHKSKIDDINKIIRELWRNTYKGNDIETIEVRSDEDEGYQFGKRRNFNYRVVMVKGDVQIDMRGRCSAGQKVLASLIIRLALAETFCLNCGVLALDEPTTNLDRENIESLAYALVEIIKNRSKQKNFQLVIITHDEDFVELMGRSDYVEKFVKVCKNDFGCSRLKEANVSELHTQ